MKNNSRSYYLSAFKEHLSPGENMDRDLELKSKLSKMGYTFISAIGCYNGIPEFSVIVSSDNASDEEFFIKLAKEYRQESILLVYGIDQTAELLYVNDSSRKTIGKMVKYDGENVVLKGRDYTYINATNSYYLVEQWKL